MGIGTLAIEPSIALLLKIGFVLLKILRRIIGLILSLRRYEKQKAGGDKANVRRGVATESRHGPLLDYDWRSGKRLYDKRT